MYDGASAFAPELVAFTGELSPTAPYVTVTSSGPFLTLVYVESWKSESRWGWGVAPTRRGGG